MPDCLSCLSPRFLKPCPHFERSKHPPHFPPLEQENSREQRPVGLVGVSMDLHAMNIWGLTQLHGPLL